MAIESKTFKDITEVDSLNDSDLFLVHDGTNVRTISVENLSEDSSSSSSSGGFEVAANAGAHNMIFRGSNLGSTVTDAQYNAIDAGTFDDLFIGDYWEINNIRWRIAHFDYYFNTGSTQCTKHHVVIVPDQCLEDSVKMEDTNTTANGYAKSKMYTANLATAKTTIQNAFGTAHLLSVKEYFENAASNGIPSGISEYDSTVDLMCEGMVYGNRIFSQSSNGTNYYRYTYQKTQLQLFHLAPRFIVARKKDDSDRWYWWLTDIVSSAYFAVVDYNGVASHSGASYLTGVRPRFQIAKSA